MELRGLADFVLAHYDNETHQIITTSGSTSTNPFTVNLSTSLGSTQGNITGLSTAPEKVYGSDAVAEQTIGVLQPSVALAANDIPHEIMDEYSGLVADKVNGGYAGKSGVLVEGGLILHSKNRTGDVDAYIAFPSGLYTPGDLTLGTNQQSPTVAHDALTFSVQARASDHLVYQKFYSDDEDFDYEKMLAFIFAGYEAKNTSTTTTTNPTTTTTTTQAQG
ncbi:phage tail protein [Lacticaseibacillus parakribbianus]|uniref:phage tail protein n=1 Tax=Lacticaseibacillus parakribbianus TaxID=2970927 RepID=UPI0021CB1778|nr:phage tail protein [Lacticaseibacillus parakribbianus]